MTILIATFMEPLYFGHSAVHSAKVNSDLNVLKISMTESAIIPVLQMRKLRKTR